MKNLNRAYLVKKIANFYFFMTVLRYFEVTFGHKEKWGPFGYPNFVIMEKKTVDIRSASSINLNIYIIILVQGRQERRTW